MAKNQFEYICYIDSEPIRKFVDRVNLQHFLKTRPEVVVVRNRTMFIPKEKLDLNSFEEAPF
jgi:hypothetical protein